MYFTVEVYPALVKNQSSFFCPYTINDFFFPCASHSIVTEKKKRLEPYNLSVGFESNVSILNTPPPHIFHLLICSVFTELLYEEVGEVGKNDTNGDCIEPSFHRSKQLPINLVPSSNQEAGTKNLYQIKVPRQDR